MSSLPLDSKPSKRSEGPSVEDQLAAIVELAQLVALFRESQGEALVDERPEDPARRQRFFQETKGAKKLRAAVAMLLGYRAQRLQRISDARVSHLARELAETVRTRGGREKLELDLKRGLQDHDISSTSEERAAIIKDILKDDLEADEAAFLRAATAIQKHVIPKELHKGMRTLRSISAAMGGKPQKSGAIQTQEEADTAIEEEHHGAAALRVALEAFLPSRTVDRVLETVRQEHSAFVALESTKPYR